MFQRCVREGPRCDVCRMKRLATILLTLIHAASPASLPPAPHITVAFAADSRYLAKLLAVVEQLRASKMGKSYRLIAYNLNPIVTEDIKLLQCSSPTLLDEVRQFDFSSFPPHVARLNCYAWKPLLLASLRREFKNSSLIWLDSGLTFGGAHREAFPDDAAAAAAANGGVLSDHTAQTMLEFTHAGMFQYFDEKLGYRKTFFTENKDHGEVLNCNGAFSAWESEDAGRARGGESVSQATMDIWETCALDGHCICPPGSSRANHRQDQAALTLAFATQGKRCYGSASGARGPYGNSTDWVHAHGLRMRNVHCQTARCFVEKHRPACLVDR